MKRLLLTLIVVFIVCLQTLIAEGTKELAVTGPNVIDSSGYPPMSFIPTMNGDYYIEFNYGHSTIQNNSERYILG